MESNCSRLKKLHVTPSIQKLLQRVPKKYAHVVSVVVGILSYYAVFLGEFQNVTALLCILQLLQSSRFSAVNFLDISVFTVDLCTANKLPRLWEFNGHSNDVSFLCEGMHWLEQSILISTFLKDVMIGMKGARLKRKVNVKVEQSKNLGREPSTLS